MRKNIFKRLISFVCCGAALLGMVSCGTNTQTSSDDTIVAETTDYVERKMIAFETQEELYSTMQAMKEVREFKLTTDAKYVTEGKSALKFVHDSEGADNYMPSAHDISPAIYFYNDEHGTGYGKDLSRVSAIVVDMYNPQNRPLEVKLFVQTLIKETQRARYVLDSVILNPGQNECVFSMELERNINMGLDNVQDICFVFPTVQPHEEEMTFYLDNLRYRVLKDEVEVKNQTLPAAPTNGLITSFEDKVMYNTTYAGYFASWKYTLKAFWNSNPDYVSEGSKSFGVIVPCAGEVWRDETPYTEISLSEEYVQSYDFAQFTSPNAKIKLDMYYKGLHDDTRAALMVYYQDGTSEKSVVVNISEIKANAWNTFEAPLYNQDGMNIGAESINRILFRFWQKKGDGNRIYYFDNIRVEG